MSKHTPTPWRLNRPADDILSSVRTENNQFVIALGTSHEDAELIVRAVNCHDDLVYAVENLLFNYRNSHSEQRKTRLESLLARARGEA